MEKRYKTFLIVFVLQNARYYQSLSSNSIHSLSVFVPSISFGQVFTENFNSLTDGTTITTSNTNFNYVRVGTGGGSIEADDDCGISGMAMNIGGTTTTSLNGVGRSAMTSSDVTTMSFTICSADWSAGDLFFGMGTGTTFTGNGTFATNDLLWGLQLNNGSLEYRTLVPSQWNAVAPAPTFSNNTCYDFHIVANGSASALTDYNGAEDLAVGRMDIYIDGTLIANDIVIVDNQSSTAFRIYQVSGGARYCIDNIAIYNAAQGPPTCSDGIQNGDETGVDCGGPDCPLVLLQPPLLPSLQSKSFLYR
ncbi:MAG: hypothetical protein IPJ74_14540 [Saprospiraceae bacterium]|nr:hypothetical protein [Saprospiraceae bacterium]